MASKLRRQLGPIVMKLSTKGRYAMVALSDIALQPHGGVVSLGDISTRQNISLPYLEQLFVKTTPFKLSNFSPRARAVGIV